MRRWSAANDGLIIRAWKRSQIRKIILKVLNDEKLGSIFVSCLSVAMQIRKELN